MRVALGSDMTGELPEAIARWLTTRGHDCFSLRATSVPVAEEVLDAWFASIPTNDPSYRAMIDSVRPL